MASEQAAPVVATAAVCSEAVVKLEASMISLILPDDQSESDTSISRPVAVMIKSADVQMTRLSSGDEETSMGSNFFSRYQVVEGAVRRLQARARGNAARRTLDHRLELPLQRYLQCSWHDYWSPDREHDANFVSPQLHAMFRLVDEAFARSEASSEARSARRWAGFGSTSNTSRVGGTQSSPRSETRSPGLPSMRSPEVAQIPPLADCPASSDAAAGQPRPRASSPSTVTMSSTATMSQTQPRGSMVPGVGPVGSPRPPQWRPPRRLLPIPHAVGGSSGDGKESASLPDASPPTSPPTSPMSPAAKEAATYVRVTIPPPAAPGVDAIPLIERPPIEQTPMARTTSQTPSQTTSCRRLHASSSEDQLPKSSTRREHFRTEEVLGRIYEVTHGAAPRGDLLDGYITSLSKGASMGEPEWMRSGVVGMGGAHGAYPLRWEAARRCVERPAHIADAPSSVLPHGSLRGSSVGQLSSLLRATSLEVPGEAPLASPDVAARAERGRRSDGSTTADGEGNLSASCAARMRTRYSDLHSEGSMRDLAEVSLAHDTTVGNASYDLGDTNVCESGERARARALALDGFARALNTQTFLQRGVARFRGLPYPVRIFVIIVIVQVVVALAMACLLIDAVVQKQLEGRRWTEGGGRGIIGAKLHELEAVAVFFHPTMADDDATLLAGGGPPAIGEVGQGGSGGKGGGNDDGKAGGDDGGGGGGLGHPPHQLPQLELVFSQVEQLLALNVSHVSDRVARMTRDPKMSWESLVGVGASVFTMCAFTLWEVANMVWNEDAISLKLATCSVGGIAAFIVYNAFAFYFDDTHNHAGERFGDLTELIERNIDWPMLIGIMTLEAVLVLLLVPTSLHADRTFGWRVFKKFSADSAHAQPSDYRNQLQLMLVRGAMRADFCLSVLAIFQAFQLIDPPTLEYDVYAPLNTYAFLGIDAQHVAKGSDGHYSRHSPLLTSRELFLLFAAIDLAQRAASFYCMDAECAWSPQFELEAIL